MQCDVTNTAHVDALVAATAKVARAGGGLHAIVNNAGIRCGPSWEVWQVGNQIPEAFKFLHFQAQVRPVPPTTLLCFAHTPHPPLQPGLRC